jgi:hypothetical protein
MATVRVDVSNFARAETDRMFAALVARGEVNRFQHTLVPTPVEEQPVIRMNRDTLYSSAIVDLARGAELTVPDAGGRYLSVMVVNEDHYINRIFHDAGKYSLDVGVFDTRYVAVAARVLVDPHDPADVAAANAVQQGLALSAGSAEPFVLPDYDENSFTEVRKAVLALANHMPEDGVRFGRKDEVDPVLHLLGTAAGWGGLPRSEAVYIGVQPNSPVGRYRIDVGEVPVDAFWSVSVYNADGYFEPNDRGVYSVNSVTARKNPDGTTTIHLGDFAGDVPNAIPITDGWNYLARLYRPRSEVLDGSWTVPRFQPA